jgi:hypothetical protein
MMEDPYLLLQTLLIVIAIPCLVLFYWFIGLRFLTLMIKIVKTIWNSTD